MPSMKKLLPLLLAVASISACATARVAGKVDVGSTPEQVQVALGKPDRVYRRQTTQGDLEAWAYMP